MAPVKGHTLAHTHKHTEDGSSSCRRHIASQKDDKCGLFFWFCFQKKKKIRKAEKRDFVSRFLFSVGWSVDWNSAQIHQRQQRINQEQTSWFVFNCGTCGENVLASPATRIKPVSYGRNVWSFRR